MTPVSMTGTTNIRASAMNPNNPYTFYEETNKYKLVFVSFTILHKVSGIQFLPDLLTTKQYWLDSALMASNKRRNYTLMQLNCYIILVSRVTDQRMSRMD